jgi:hypothetical protein
MKLWDDETGQYWTLDSIWNLAEDLRGSESPLDPLEGWLSRPGGNHHIGLSFHFSSHSFPEGEGVIDGNYHYSVAPFLLHSVQDPYNSWGVNARLRNRSSDDGMEYWHWLPGIQIVDLSQNFTLPDIELSGSAGCEWTDNDYRVYCGFYDVEHYSQILQDFLRLVNRLTGPGWAGWPFGERQLTRAVMFWTKSPKTVPEILLLASPPQFGEKHVHLDERLFHPGEKLGAWELRPPLWDCRQSLRFLHQAKLMLADGLPEMAVSTGIAALENASAEILLYVLGGDKSKAESVLGRCRFLNRFDTILPDYDVKLPPDLFSALRDAYLSRNGVIHGLRPILPEDAAKHLETIERVLIWYWESMGGPPSQIGKNIPF